MNRLKDGLTSYSRWLPPLLAALSALVLSMALAGCSPTKTDRVRVTVEVTDGANIYSGSAVQELRCRQADPMWGNMDTGNCEIRGEAVAVDMKTHGPLFMIFAAKQGYYAGPYIGAIFGAKPNDSAQQWELQPSNLPLFVAFQNPANANTVFEVDPNGSNQTRGGNIKVVAVRVHYSNEPITSDEIRKYLPWIPQRSSNTYLTGETSRSANDLASRLQNYNFTTIGNKQ